VYDASRLISDSNSLRCWPSWELKSSLDRVGESEWSLSKGVVVRVTTPDCWRKRRSSSRSLILYFSTERRRASSSLFRTSSASTSWRFRSREDWAARRLRRTRSTRLCSFSSSVLARFLESGVSNHLSTRRRTPPRFATNLPWWKVGLGFGEDLTPRLPLLGRLLFIIGGRGRIRRCR